MFRFKGTKEMIEGPKENLAKVRPKNEA